MSGTPLGLAVVCAVFFSAKAGLADGVGDVTDKVVGASMVLLGVLVLVQLRAWRRRRALERAHPDDALVNAAADLNRTPREAADRGAARATRRARRNRQNKARSPPARRWRFGRAAPRMRAHDLDLPHARRRGERRASLRLFRRRATEKTKGSKLMTTYRSLRDALERTSSADGRPFQSCGCRVRRERERERERNANARRRARGGPSP